MRLAYSYPFRQDRTGILINQSGLYSHSQMGYLYNLVPSNIRIYDMKQNLNINKNLTDFLTEFPETKDIFELFGVDYETFSKKNIPDIVKENDIQLDTLIFSLNEKISKKMKFLENKSLSDVISHIERVHHSFLWENLPSADMLLDEIIKTHGKEDGDFLLGLRKIFGTLKNSLENHLESEEYDLFALIKDAEKHPKKKKKMPENVIDSKINSLYVEHDQTNHLLAEMRNFTKEYEMPSYASGKFKELYAKLKAIENDLHEHIYIENIILLPKVKKLLV